MMLLQPKGGRRLIAPRVARRGVHAEVSAADPHRTKCGPRCLFLAAIVATASVHVSASVVTAATRALGIDVSSFQGAINWNAVKSDGIDFAWAKATEGSASYVDYTDAYLGANMAGASGSGILIGAYHFAHPLHDPGAAGAQAEADFFVASAGQYMTAGYLRPVLDLEVEGSSATSTWVNDFLSDVDEATGVTPIVYTYIDYSESYLDSTVANRNLWIANPSGASPQVGEPTVPSPFTNWNFWQYGQSTINGISGAVDQDVANGNLAYVQNFLIPAQVQLPGSAEDAATVAWTGGGTDGNWSNAANWTANWAPGDVAEFTSSSGHTDNITFDEVAAGNKVVNVAQIDVANSNTPAVTINGSDTIDFQTYVDPIYNNSGNTLTINAPTAFYGTMGSNGNANINHIYTGPGNIVLGGSITFNDSQSQVSNFGFNDIIAVSDNRVNNAPGNFIMNGVILDAPGTPAGYVNGFIFENNAGYDDITSDNANWSGGMHVENGATLLVSSGASTGTGPVTLDGAAGIAGEGTVSGPVTLTGGQSVITAGGELINNFSDFSATAGKLTLAAGLNLNAQTATFNFYLRGRSNGVISIGNTFTLSSRDVVNLSGGLMAGTYQLFEYQVLADATDLGSWTISGPSGFSYLLRNNTADNSIDLIATATPEPTPLMLLAAGLVLPMLLHRRRSSSLKNCLGSPMPDSLIRKHRRAELRYRRLA